ncbi:MAG: hypothetical protein MHM6MM_003648 [Cercozoa sp. M6MM]
MSWMRQDELDDTDFLEETFKAHGADGPALLLEVDATGGDLDRHAQEAQYTKFVNNPTDKQTSKVLRRLLSCGSHSRISSASISSLDRRCFWGYGDAMRKTDSSTRLQLSGDDSFSDTDKSLVMLWYRLWKSLFKQEDFDGCLDEFDDMEDFDSAPVEPTPKRQKLR